MTARPALSQEGMAALDAALEALKSEPGSPAILIALALAVASSVRKADAEKVKALASYDGTGCNDKAHDNRWCQSCESRNDALEEAAAAIEQEGE